MWEILLNNPVIGLFDNPIFWGLIGLCFLASIIRP